MLIAERVFAMARYEHLPIFKTAMDLPVYIEQVVRNLSRYHKYTVGSDLRQQSRELVTLKPVGTPRRSNFDFCRGRSEHPVGASIVSPPRVARHV